MITLHNMKMKMNTMKRITLSIIAVIFLGNISLHAQQIPLSNLYTSNNYLLNPAYAGQQQCGEIYATHRRQWVGIANAPVTSFLSGNAYLGKNMGVGLKLYNDKASFLQQNYGMLSFAYHLQVGETSKLSFGLSAGMFNNSIDQSQITANDMTDDLFTGGNFKATVETDFGLVFKSQKLNLGVSVPRFIETTSKFTSPLDQGVFTLRRHILGYGSYDINVGQNGVFRPSVMTRWVPGIDMQYDVNADYYMNDKFSVGAGYREQAGIIARLGLVMKNLQFNYAYEFFGGGITSRSGGSHEIRLGFKWCKKEDSMDTTATDPKENTLVIKNDEGEESFTFKTLKQMEDYANSLEGKDDLLADRIRQQMASNPESERIVVDNTSIIMQVRKDDGKEEFKFRTLKEIDDYILKMEKEDPILAARIRAQRDKLSDDDRKLIVDDRSIKVTVKTKEKEQEFKFRTLEEMNDYIAKLETENPKLAAILKQKIQQDPDSKLYSAIIYEEDPEGNMVTNNTEASDELNEEEIELLSKSIEFGMNKSSALDKSKPTLNKAIAIMKKHPTLKLEIDGYTCDIGESEVNKELSLQRAEYVADYFKRNGISGSRITTKGYGQKYPLMPNTTDANRAKNRRVQFKVVE